VSLNSLLDGAVPWLTNMVAPKVRRLTDSPLKKDFIAWSQCYQKSNRHRHVIKNIILKSGESCIKRDEEGIGCDSAIQRFQMGRVHQEESEFEFSRPAKFL
jgi:hypothetical protein